MEKLIKDFTSALYVEPINLPKERYIEYDTKALDGWNDEMEFFYDPEAKRFTDDGYIVDDLEDSIGCETPKQRKLFRKYANEQIRDYECRIGRSDQLIYQCDVDHRKNFGLIAMIQASTLLIGIFDVRNYSLKDFKTKFAKLSAAKTNEKLKNNKKGS